jgi:hypothetical protein
LKDAPTQLLQAFYGDASQLDYLKSVRLIPRRKNAPGLPNHRITLTGRNPFRQQPVKKQHSGLLDSGGLLPKRFHERHASAGLLYWQARRAGISLAQSEALPHYGSAKPWVSRFSQESAPLAGRQNRTTNQQELLR